MTSRFGIALLVALATTLQASAHVAQVSCLPVGTTIGMTVEHGHRSFRSLVMVAQIVDARDQTKLLGLYAIDEQGDAWISARKGYGLRPDLLTMTRVASAKKNGVPTFTIPAIAGALPSTLRLTACSPK